MDYFYVYVFKKILTSSILYQIVLQIHLVLRRVNFSLDCYSFFFFWISTHQNEDKSLL